MGDQSNFPLSRIGAGPQGKRLVAQKFIAASTRLAGSVFAGGRCRHACRRPAPRGGADLSGHSERSKYVKIGRIPESTPGKRNVDPSEAINSKTPLDKLFGAITPSDLHYERSHSGAPDLDPAKHRLLVHGMVLKPLVFNVEDLKAMPSISRTVFIECTGNGWENWKRADENVTVQNTHGLVSTNEWTGVPLKFLVDLVGKDRNSSWMLAEGGDAAGVARSIPLTERDPKRGVRSLWAERRAAAARARLSDATGHAGLRRQPQHQMVASPRIRRPALDDALGDRSLYAASAEWQGHPIPASYGHQFRDHLTLGNDGDQAGLPADHGTGLERPRQNRQGGDLHRRPKTWKEGQLNLPALPKAQTRFQMDWVWDGKPTKIVSRSTDDKGNVQPDRKSFIAAVGTNALFHYNAQQTWSIDETGRVRNVLD